MRIRKISPITPANGNIENIHGNSQVDTYSQEYLNDKIVNVGVTNSDNYDLWLKKSKNMIRPFKSGDLNNLTITTDSTGKTTITGTSSAAGSTNTRVYVYLKPGQYTLSCNLTGTVPSSSSQIILKKDGLTTNFATINLWQTDKATFTVTEETYADTLRFYSNPNITYNITLQIQLEKGSTATTYEPYTGMSLKVNDRNILNQNKTDYLPSEQVIGTWVDGRPIYRQYFDISNITTTNADLINVASYNMNEIINLHGFLKTGGGGWFPIPLTDSSTNLSVLFISGAKMLRGRALTGDGTGVAKAYALVEYTKTTD